MRGLYKTGFKTSSFLLIGKIARDTFRMSLHASILYYMTKLGLVLGPKNWSPNQLFSLLSHSFILLTCKCHPSQILCSMLGNFCEE